MSTEEIDFELYSLENQLEEARWWNRMATKLVNAKEDTNLFDVLDTTTDERIKWLEKKIATQKAKRSTK